MSLIIRAATINDTDTLLTLIKQLAVYEKKKPEDVELTAAKIIDHGFGSIPYFQTLLAEYNQEIVGYALYFFTYAATAGAPILYLEDLFVLGEYRHKQIGTAILAELAKIATQKNCCRMEWHAYTWNESAIDFYSSLGATLRPDLAQIRLEDKALNELTAFRRNSTA